MKKTNAENRQDQSFTAWLKDGKTPDLLSVYLGLIGPLCRLNIVKESTEAFQALLTKYGGDLQIFDEQFLPLTSLDWVFMDTHTRQKYRSLYEKRKAIGNSPFQKPIQDERNAFTRADQASPEDLAREFCHHRSGFFPLIHHIQKENRSSSKTPTVLRSLLDEFQKVEHEVELPESKIEKIKPALTQHIDQLVSSELFKKLKTMPSSDCSKGIKGLRIKALVDNNHETMADLYLASSSALSAIKGISENSARAIKTYVKQVAEELEPEIRIRVDHLVDTEENRKLVSYLYGILRLQTVSENLYQVKQGAYSEARQNAKTLSAVQLGLDALLYEENRLHTIEEAYASLSGYLKTASDVSLFRSIRADVRGAQRYTSDEAWKDYKERPVSYIVLMENLFPELSGADDGSYGLPEGLTAEIYEQEFFPDGLRVNLRKYQIWGVKYALHQKRVLLGDGMGLGKTAQAIGTVVSLRNTGTKHFMVVCPLGVLLNWCREIRQFSHLRLFSIYGPDYSKELKTWMKLGGIAVMTFETVQKIVKNEMTAPDLLIVDEAHYVKNPKAKRSAAVSEICQKASHVLFLTGTPIENNAGEMVHLIEMLQPDIARKIKRHSTGNTAAKVFRDTIAPVYFRRKKESVLSELPEKIESMEWCEMSTDERAFTKRTSWRETIWDGSCPLMWTLCRIPARQNV